MKEKIVIILLIIFVLSINYLWAGDNNKEKDRLIVFDMAAEVGIDKGVVNAITEIVIDEVTKLNRFEVIGQKDLDKMLFWESQKSLKNCTESSCLVQIAGAMGAKYYVEGQIAGVGKKYVITLKWMDAEGVKVIKRATRQIERDEDVLLKEMGVLIGEIFGEAKKGTGVVNEKGKTGGAGGISTNKVVGRGVDIVPYISFGIGVVGIGAGVTGLLFMRDVNEGLKDGRYNTEGEAKGDMDKWRWVSTGGFVLGGIGMVYGVYRLISGGEEEVKGKKGMIRVGNNYIAMEVLW